MEISALRQRLSAAMLEFAWDEWSQMGVLAAPPRPRRWAEDPEALLIFTFEVARDDPRLFDEVLDWLVRNEPLVSARRLRTLCEDADDRRLSDAAMDWVMRELRPRSAGRAAANPNHDPEALFRGAGGGALPVLRPDPVFLAHGLLRPPAMPTGKSSGPDLWAPINFAFRLRQLLGVGTRAEAVRYLLTADIDTATVAVVASSSAYAKRNVQEALSALQAAGAASVVTAGGEQRFAVDRSRWAFLLGLDVKELPVYRDWPNLLGALRQILRWLMRPDLESLSDYLLASEAADLLDEVGPRFNRAGILVPARHGGDRTWSDLEDTVETALFWLAPQRARARRPRGSKWSRMSRAGTRGDSPATTGGSWQGRRIHMPRRPRHVRQSDGCRARLARSRSRSSATPARSAGTWWPTTAGSWASRVSCSQRPATPSAPHGTRASSCSVRCRLRKLHPR